VGFVANLVWAVLSTILLVLTYRGVRRGTIRLSMVSALMLALAVCLILLPVISMNDDMLEAQQDALPFSGQTWRMASEAASVGLDLLLALAAYLLLLVSYQAEARRSVQDVCDVRPMARRLARSQRLRPPPCAA
jgi:hypothetical protein